MITNLAATVNAVGAVARTVTTDVTVLAARYVAPTVSWNPSAGLVTTCRNVAFFLAVIWLIWVLAQFALPKRRNMLQQGGIGAGRFIAAGALIVVLLDISMIPTVINWFLQLLWWVKSFVPGLG